MGKEQYSGKTICVLRFALACEQALRGALAAGREKEGELATTGVFLSANPKTDFGS